jgi:ATP-dependent helicase Lhr and Lhr-like helicase
VSLHVADSAPLTLPDPVDEFSRTELHDSVRDVLSTGGAFFFR